MILRTVFEMVMIALIICGFIFEPKLAAWEQKMFARIKTKIQNNKAAAKRKEFVVIEGKR